eukprot:GHVR01008604.1.p1 GENE.GHVR01008604.1~~GHVR01008604.1.p1  ORF type:complete len:709 (+),score=151.04 GHVR01008604.1:320-2128(+)
MLDNILNNIFKSENNNDTLKLVTTLYNECITPKEDSMQSFLTENFPSLLVRIPLPNKDTGRLNVIAQRLAMVYNRGVDVFFELHRRHNTVENKDKGPPVLSIVRGNAGIDEVYLSLWDNKNVWDHYTNMIADWFKLLFNIDHEAALLRGVGVWDFESQLYSWHNGIHSYPTGQTTSADNHFPNIFNFETFYSSFWKHFLEDIEFVDKDTKNLKVSVGKMRYIEQLMFMLNNENEETIMDVILVAVIKKYAQYGVLKWRLPLEKFLTEGVGVNPMSNFDRCYPKRLINLLAEDFKKENVSDTMLAVYKDVFTAVKETVVDQIEASAIDKNIGVELLNRVKTMEVDVLMLTDTQEVTQIINIQNIIDEKSYLKQYSILFYQLRKNDFNNVEVHPSLPSVSVASPAIHYSATSNRIITTPSALFEPLLYTPSSNTSSFTPTDVDQLIKTYGGIGFMISKAIVGSYTQPALATDCSYKFQMGSGGVVGGKLREALLSHVNKKKNCYFKQMETVAKANTFHANRTIAEYIQDSEGSRVAWLTLKKIANNLNVKIDWTSFKNSLTSNICECNSQVYDLYNAYLPFPPVEYRIASFGSNNDDKLMCKAI